MSEQLKQMFREAERRGDRATAEAILRKLSKPTIEQAPAKPAPTEPAPVQQAANLDEFAPAQPIQAGMTPSLELEPGEKDTMASAIGKVVEQTPTRWKKRGGGLMAMAGDQGERNLMNSMRPLMEKAARGEEFSFMDKVKVAFDMASTPLTTLFARQKAREQENYDQTPMAQAEQWLAKRGREIAEEAERDLQANRIDTDDPVAQFAADVATGAIDMVPMLTAGFLTRNPQAAQAMNPAAMTVLAGQVGGEKYIDRINRGATTDEAMDAVKFQLVAEVVPEQIPLNALIRKGSPFLKRWFDATIGEGAQEALTGVLEQVYDKQTLDNMTLKDALMNIDWSDAAYQGLIGLGVGTTLAAPSQAVDVLTREKAVDQEGQDANLFNATHEIVTDRGTRVPIQEVTRQGEPVPGRYIDRKGNVFNYQNAQPVEQNPMDAGVQMENIRREVMSGRSPEQARQGIIDSIFDVEPTELPGAADIYQGELGAARARQATIDVTDVTEPFTTEGGAVAPEPVAEQPAPEPVPAEPEVTPEQEQAQLEERARQRGLTEPEEIRQFVIDQQMGGRPTPEELRQREIERVPTEAKTREEYFGLPEYRQEIEQRASTVLKPAKPEAYDRKGLEANLKDLSKASKALEKKKVPSVEAYLAEKGGLDTQAAIAAGLDPADIKAANRKGMPFGKSLFKKGGMTMDEAAEAMAEIGVAGMVERMAGGREAQAPSANAALDLLDTFVKTGQPTALPGEQETQAEMDAERRRIDELTQQSEAMLDELNEYDRLLETEGKAAADAYFYEQRRFETAAEQVRTGEIEYDGEVVTADTTFDEAGETLASLLDQAFAIDGNRAETVFERLAIQGATNAEIALAMNNIIRGEERAKAEAVEAETEKAEPAGPSRAEAAPTEEAKRAKPEPKPEPERVTPELELETQTEEGLAQREAEQAERAERAEIEKTVEGFELEGEVTPIEQSAAQAGLFEAEQTAAAQPSETAVTSPRETITPAPAPAEAAPAPVTEDYTRFEGLDISYEVETADTGETFTVTVDAATALREVDSRLDALRQLRDCV